MIKSSIYTTAYLLNKNNFKFLDNLIKFSKFANEVVIASCEDGLVDGSEQLILDFIKYNDLYNVDFYISHDINFSQNTFDGALKNFALQNTKNEIKLQFDLDESPVLSQKPIWDHVYEDLINSNYDAVFIPSIDLYGSEKYIRKNHKIGQKWRIHKAGLYRGVVNFAKNNDSSFDTEKSDSCELLNSFGNLVNTINITPPELLMPENSKMLAKDYLYTIHHGYLNLGYRANINKTWWQQKWRERTNKEINVTIDIKKLESEDLIEHNLPLD